MDSHALLSAQGWRGTGHSLHKTDDSIGLAKPLLLNRKNNTHGLGQKQHFTSDQWWMNAFDEQLQGLDTSKDGKVVQTVTNGKLNSIENASLGKWALYPSFVRGGLLEGTITFTSSTATSATESEDSEEMSKTTERRKKNKSSKGTVDVDGPTETKEARRRRKEDKRRRKEERALAKADRKEQKAGKTQGVDSVETSEEESKRRRRARKEEKRRQREQEKSN